MSKADAFYLIFFGHFASSDALVLPLPTGTLVPFGGLKALT